MPKEALGVKRGDEQRKMRPYGRSTAAPESAEEARAHRNNFGMAKESRELLWRK